MTKSPPKIIHCVGFKDDLGFVDLDVAQFFECYDDALEFLELLENQRRKTDCTRMPAGIYNVEVQPKNYDQSECF